MFDQDAQAPDDSDLYEQFTPLIRQFTPPDQNYILRTWMKVYILECYLTNRVRYFDKMQIRIHKICTDPRTVVTVVCDENHEDFIVGFAIGEVAPERSLQPIVLHFAYVRQAYRRSGIFKMMLKRFGWSQGRKILATHRTRFLNPIWKQMNFDHDPFILEGIRSPKDTDTEDSYI